MTTPILRFAPSPNGHLHLGHAYSALLNHDLARAHGGRFLLRIEDIDAARCRPEYEAAILEDLAWLGLTWEEPVWRQSERLAHYQAAIARLDRDGLVYASFESRADISRMVREREASGPWPRDPDGAPLYPGSARALPAAERERRQGAGEAYALRLDLAAALARVGALAWLEQGPDGRAITSRWWSMTRRRVSRT
jgi:glutamyl-Q tRNA(Asp) synthetase